MSIELEVRIRGWVDEEVAGIEPVSAEEAMERSSKPASTSVGPAGGRGGRRWLLPAAAAIAVVAGAVGVVAIGRHDRREVVRASQTGDAGPGPDAGSPGTRPEVVGPEGESDDGWETFVEPTFGWTWEQPAGWTSQSERDHCEPMLGIDGTFVTNTAQRYSHASSEGGCTTAWVLPRPLPERFVGVYVVHMEERMTELGDFPSEPTDFPLSLEDFGPLSAVDLQMIEQLAPAVPPPTRTLVVNHEGRRYGVTTFEGAAVTADDMAALERLIGSIEPND